MDSGGEVRFSVEIVRVKGLKGLYALDLRRMKGSLHDYKENHVGGRYFSLIRYFSS